MSTESSSPQSPPTVAGEVLSSPQSPPTVAGEVYSDEQKYIRIFSDSIEDVVNGPIHLEPLHLKFVNSKEFQRLCYVKQLGMAYQIFPGATHSRFDHSLGVYSLAAQSVNSLHEKQGLELGIDRFDVKAVKLAGLLHNVAHPPFDHLFERDLLPRLLPDLEWSHADMVKKLVQYIVDEHYIDVEADLIARVEEMILASSKTPSSSTTEKRFLFDIVANGRNGVDVDKFDYISRDSRACGQYCDFKFKRLIETMQVMGDEICYREEDCLKVHNMFSTQAYLHKSVYAERRVKGVELMVVDALVAANLSNPVWDYIDKPSNYCQLDDRIIDLIENNDLDVCYDLLYGSGDDPKNNRRRAHLIEARNIIQRIRRKEFYEFCNEFVVPKEKIEHIKDVTAEEIVCFQKSSEKTIKPEDVVVSYVRNELTHLENIHFFQDNTSDKIKIPNDWVSHLPAFNQDTIVRVYSKKPEMVGVISGAFENYKNQYRN